MQRVVHTSDGVEVGWGETVSFERVQRTRCEKDIEGACYEFRMFRYSLAITIRSCTPAPHAHRSRGSGVDADNLHIFAVPRRELSDGDWRWLRGWGIATRRRYDDVTWKSRESVWAFAVTARHRWASLVGHALVLVRSRPDLEPRAVIFFQARRACSSTPERHRRPTSSFMQLAVVSVALIFYR